MIINELDIVLLKDGREGTVIDIYENGNVFLIEICNSKGETLCTPFVKKEDIACVTHYKKSEQNQ